MASGKWDKRANAGHPGLFPSLVDQTPYSLVRSRILQGNALRLGFAALQEATEAGCLLS